MKLLLVEDEVKLAKAIRRALELQGYVVDAVFDGEIGLDLAQTQPYDLIILDLNLPHLNGLDICHQLRQDHHNTPVLILTARGQVGDKVTGLDVGADDYMVKPFSFDELFARIRALLRRPPESTSQALKVQHLVLNTSTRSVCNHGQPLHLSVKEYAILEYLMLHQGKVVSKEQLLNHVWPYDTDVLPSTIEVHIKHLRDKIGQSLIHTVRGFGYQIK